jgi:hypothetical protein
MEAPIMYYRKERGLIHNCGICCIIDKESVMQGSGGHTEVLHSVAAAASKVK